MKFDLTESQTISEMVETFNQIDFETFLVANGGHRLSAFSSPLLKMPAIAVSFVDWLEDEEAAAITLLGAFVASYPLSALVPSITPILTRLKNAVAGSGAPASAWLIEGVPVIDRTPLRATLQALKGGGPRLVTLIDGPVGTGRTHSWFLIRHVAKTVPNAFPVKFDLTAPIVQQRTLPFLVQNLARKLQLTSFTLSESTGLTGETLASLFADDIADAWNAQMGSRVPWVAFDGLDRQVAPEIRAFICALVHKRLSADIGQGVFFLLGAGSDYGVIDANRRLNIEHLTPFTLGDVALAATAINLLGQAPLAPAPLKERIDAMAAKLTVGTPGEIVRSVGRLLQDLRGEVQA